MVGKRVRYKTVSATRTRGDCDDCWFDRTGTVLGVSVVGDLCIQSISNATGYPAALGAAEREMWTVLWDDDDDREHVSAEYLELVED